MLKSISNKMLIRLWLHQNGMWGYIRDKGEMHEADAEDMDKL